MITANTFTASSDAAETSPVAKLPADADTTLWGVGVGDAAGEEHLIHNRQQNTTIQPTNK